MPKTLLRASKDEIERQTSRSGVSPAPKAHVIDGCGARRRVNPQCGSPRSPLRLNLPQPGSPHHYSSLALESEMREFHYAFLFGGTRRVESQIIEHLSNVGVSRHAGSSHAKDSGQGPLLRGLPAPTTTLNIFPPVQLCCERMSATWTLRFGWFWRMPVVAVPCYAKLSTSQRSKIS